MYQLVLTTCPDEIVAKKIAQQLVTEKLAAYVNIVPKITSVYSWENEIQYDTRSTLRCRIQLEL